MISVHSVNADLSSQTNRTLLRLVSEVPLWENGLTFHHLGLILCAGFGLIGIICSVFLALMHATHYSKPREQRQYVQCPCNYSIPGRKDMENRSLTAIHNEQYNAYSIYGSHILRRILPLLPLLSRIGIFRNPRIVLRSLRPFILLHTALSLRGT